VEVTVKNNLTKEETVMKNEEGGLPLPPQEETLATVGIKAGCTVSIQPYESARIDVSLFYPCKPEKVDETYEEVKNWVDRRLNKEYNELKQYADE
jgi:hypothetical protein